MGAAVGLALLGVSREARAYPEMTRYGYGNCSSCHVSVTGGGLLSEHGRVLSKEIISHGRFFFEKGPETLDTGGSPAPLVASEESREESFLYGAVSTPAWLQLGGNLRFRQLIEDTPSAVTGRFLVMRLDLEAAITDGKRFTLVGTLGRSEPNGNAAADSPLSYLISRRHWLSVKMGPEGGQGELDRYQLRVGRFYYAYGLQIDEPTMLTRGLMGFAEEQETYNVEFTYFTTDTQVHATVVMGRPDNPQLGVEQGFSLQAGHAVSDRVKLGGNIYTGKATNAASNTRRWLVGPYAIFSWSRTVYTLFELNATYADALGSGGTQMTKTGWEFSRGVQAFVTQEYARVAGSPRSYSRDNYGLGLQYFPRPHWEFSAIGRRERSHAVSADFANVLWFTLHYYL